MALKSRDPKTRPDYDPYLNPLGVSLRQPRSIGDETWDNYYATLDRISGDPSPVSQNWSLRGLEDPSQSAQLTPRTPWGDFSNILRHRGAMMGKTIEFDPYEQGVAQRQGQVDREEFDQQRQVQMARAGLRLAGRR
jgi:hypothetical protein